MMLYVTDTHALLWYLARPERLGAQARQAFDEVKSGKATIIVPAIVLAELIWTIERGRIQTDLQRVLATICKHYIITPLIPADVLKLPELTNIPEMHDRMIVAEAKRRNAPVITRDENISRSGAVSVVW